MKNLLLASIFMISASGCTPRVDSAPEYTGRSDGASYSSPSPTKKRKPAPPPEPESRTDTSYEARFAAVSKIFTDMGARVDPLDPSVPYTMRAYLPNSVAMDLTERQARELAGMARERLDEKAIVYIKTEAGQTIGKATPWGFE